MKFLRSIVTGIFALAVTSTAEASQNHLVQDSSARMEQVSGWILNFITEAAPPGRKVYYTDGQETLEEAKARYESITRDIIDVVYDPHTRPLFKGPVGRSQTVAMILSVMLHESGFMRHVDYGIGKYARGDQGDSWCMMQINIGTRRTMPWNVVHDRPVVWNDPKDQIQQGYTGEELVGNRKLCISEGLKVLRVSFAVCGKLPLEDRLRSYASGSCEKGVTESRNRVRKAMKWFDKTFQGRFTDAQVMAARTEQRLLQFVSEPTGKNPHVM